MPPTNSTVQALSDDEKMNFARWIDLGCPINFHTNLGWFADDLPPTLTVSRPRQNANNTPLSEIRIGFADGYSGINTSTFSIKADFDVNGIAPTNELKGLGSFVDDGIFAIPLTTPVINMATSHVTATVFDKQGNKTVTRVRFWVEPLGEDSSVVHAYFFGTNQSQVLLRFKDLATNLNHVVYGSEDLKKPFAQWTLLGQLDYTNEANSIRRIRVLLPAGPTNSYFFRVQKP
jgi:hypothetical protein